MAQINAMFSITKSLLNKELLLIVDIDIVFIKTKFIQIFCFVYVALFNWYMSTYFTYCRLK